jgi:hypothetical protein
MVAFLNGNGTKAAHAVFENMVEHKYVIRAGAKYFYQSGTSTKRGWFEMIDDRILVRPLNEKMSLRYYKEILNGWFDDDKSNQESPIKVSDKYSLIPNSGIIENCTNQENFIKKQQGESDNSKAGAAFYKQRKITGVFMQEVSVVSWRLGVLYNFGVSGHNAFGGDNDWMKEAEELGCLVKYKENVPRIILYPFDIREFLTVEIIKTIVLSSHSAMQGTNKSSDLPVLVIMCVRHEEHPAVLKSIVRLDSNGYVTLDVESIVRIIEESNKYNIMASDLYIGYQYGYPIIDSGASFRKIEDELRQRGLLREPNEENSKGGKIVWGGIYDVLYSFIGDLKLNRHWLTPSAPALLAKGLGMWPPFSDEDLADYLNNEI